MVSAGWPCFLHCTKTFVKTIPASDNISVEDVLQVLHPPALAGPNSSVITKSDDVVDPSKPIAYTCTRTKQEVLAVLRLFTITHTVRIDWKATDDGTDIKFETGRGITISQQWRVKQNEESQEVEILMNSWYLPAHIPLLSTRKSSNLYNTTCLLLITVALLCFLYRRRNTKTNDPYGLFHLSLNKRQGEDANSPPVTEWLNMGYWKDTNIFPDACQALALKLVRAAQCQEDGNVFGTLSAHPLNPSSTSNRFNSILALDCAYHFQTRELFLRQSFHQLLPNGRIALADICFSNALPMNPWVRLIRRVLKLMPQENAISIDDYIRCLEQIGYEDAKIEDISEDVFPGFVAFLKSRGLGWWLFGFVMYQYYSAGARFVIASASRYRKE
ncbi:hypothetical protein EV360DRAFT_34776 [Lentinula raphanica]|nr:hypothetical protein EV360DRAFT_34776 [Lentinula raphanica]